MSDKLNIYSYTDYREFLRDYYKREKEVNPDKMSYRYLAKRAGFSSANFLHLVMTNKRNLSAESVQRVARLLKLNKRETLFFNSMVLFNQIKDPKEKGHAYQRMLAFKEYRSARRLSDEEYSYFSKWYYPVIRELVHLREFKPDPKWIAKKLSPNISEEAAAEALRHLLKLKIIVPNNKGGLTTAEANITSGDDIASIALRSFHEQMIEHGKGSLAHPAEDREISALTMSLSDTQFGKIKERIREFHRDVQQLIVDEQDTDTGEVTKVCQLNFQLFHLIEK